MEYVLLKVSYVNACDIVLDNTVVLSKRVRRDFKHELWKEKSMTMESSERN